MLDPGEASGDCRFQPEAMEILENKHVAPPSPVCGQHEDRVVLAGTVCVGGWCMAAEWREIL